MKAKIDPAGRLTIKRGPIWRAQYCQQDPANAHPDTTEPPRCGDHCPHFFERPMTGDGPLKAHIEVSIRCCPLEVVYKIEEDNRGTANSTDDSKANS